MLTVIKKKNRASTVTVVTFNSELNVNIYICFKHDIIIFIISQRIF